METNSKALATALLVMDIQPAVMQMMGENAAPLAATISQAIGGARAKRPALDQVMAAAHRGI